jgi:hypothetical protein
VILLQIDLVLGFFLLRLVRGKIGTKPYNKLSIPPHLLPFESRPGLREALDWVLKFRFRMIVYPASWGLMTQMVRGGLELQ